jgi:ABC-type transporter Mla MlaB component
MGWVEVRTGTAHGQPCVVMRLYGRLSDEQLAALCRRVDALIRPGHGCGERIGLVCDVTAIDAVDLAVVDQLARLRLAARRAGGTVTFQHAAPALKALLALIGLDDLLLADSGEATSVECQRQAEQLEKTGVEKDVEVRHPPL